MIKELKGIFTALLTPFDENGNVNLKELDKLVEFNLNKGVTGFYVDGSTAEAFLLSEDERKLILKSVCDCVGGRCTLIAHIGCIGTADAIRLGKYAAGLGYDVISSVAPFYYKFSFDEIYKYYMDIAEATNMPILLYNFPSFSGVTLSVEQIGKFLSDDRFIGVKHTSSDYFALRQLKTAFPDKVIYNGYDETFLAGLSMGADGAIGSTFNFMADKYINILKLFRENRISEAINLQKEADIIISALCRCGVMQGEKAILEEMGFKFGNARAPFAPLSNDARQELLNTVMPLLEKHNN